MGSLTISRLHKTKFRQLITNMFSIAHRTTYEKPMFVNILKCSVLAFALCTILITVNLVGKHARQENKISGLRETRRELQTNSIQFKLFNAELDTLFAEIKPNDVVILGVTPASSMTIAVAVTGYKPSSVKISLC
jgi:ABC-type uncharacterized transport system substrate-binding protein